MPKVERGNSGELLKLKFERQIIRPMRSLVELFFLLFRPREPLDTLRTAKFICALRGRHNRHDRLRDEPSGKFTANASASSWASLSRIEPNGVKYNRQPRAPNMRSYTDLWLQPNRLLVNNLP
jgi:hypothetical protein